MTHRPAQPPVAEPTDEQLRLAYRQLRQPNRWPATLEAAMAHPVYGKCLRQLAISLARPKWQASPIATSLPQGPGVPAHTAAQPKPAATAKPAPAKAPRRPASAVKAAPLGNRGRGIDLKRKAANDRDDD